MSQFTAECTLLKRGVSLDELKQFGQRHNLDALLNRICELKVPISESTRLLVAKLSEQHKTHALRYTFLNDDGIPTFTPPPEMLYVALDELMMAGRISTHGI